MAVADLLPAMTERIVRRFAPIEIILFGSQARGDAGPHSDVDLLVVLSEVKDAWRTIGDILGELRDFHISTDVAVTTPEEIARRGSMVGTLLRPALREGRILYEREGNGRRLEAGAATEEEVRREVGQWLLFVEDDLATALHDLTRLDLSPRHGGFNAQQAAEKALKAVYIFAQVQYPFSHDLDALRGGIPSGWPFKDEFPNLHELSLWAVDQRYPGAQTAATYDDARRHVQLARAFIDAILRDLAEHGYSG